MNVFNGVSARTRCPPKNVKIIDLYTINAISSYLSRYVIFYLKKKSNSLHKRYDSILFTRAEESMCYYLKLCIVPLGKIICNKG